MYNAVLQAIRQSSLVPVLTSVLVCLVGIEVMVSLAVCGVLVCWVGIEVMVSLAVCVCVGLLGGD